MFNFVCWCREQNAHGCFFFMNHSKLVSVALREQFFGAVYVRLASSGELLQISQMSQMTVDEHTLRQLALDFLQQLTPVYEIVPPHLQKISSVCNPKLLLSGKKFGNS